MPSESDPRALRRGDTLNLGRWRCSLERFRQFCGPGVRNHHTDAEEARKIGLPGPLAPGAMLTGLVWNAVTAELGPRWLDGGRLSVTYLAPVWANDELVLHARVHRSEAGIVRLAITMTTADGRTVLVGEVQEGEA